MSSKNRSVGLVLILSAVAALLVGCDLGAEKSMRAAPVWSRGEQIGTAALNNPVGMAVDGNGARIHMAWVAEGESGELLHYVQLNDRAEIVVDTDLPVQVAHPQYVQLLSDGGGTSHLFWRDSREGALALYHLLINADGKAGTYPTRLSPVGAIVESFHAGFNAQGQIEVFWCCENGDLPGVYQTRLDPWGEITLPNTLVRSGGVDPWFALAEDGTLHLTWVEKPSRDEYEVYHGTLSPVAATLTRPTQVGFYSAPTGLTAHSPRIGLASGQAYIFWSLERRGGGLTPPSADSFYVTFPQGSPVLGPATQIGIPGQASPRYHPVDGDFNYRELALPVEGPEAIYTNSAFVYQVCLAGGGESELAAAFATQLSTRAQDRMQIALTIWSEGRLKGYQVAARTRTSSLRPQLAIDSAGDFHLAWIDTAGFGEYSVYYATTSPTARALLNRVTTRDVFSGVFNVLWGFGQAVSFFPVFLFWVLLPLVWISVYSFIRVDDDLTSTTSKVALGISYVIYFFAKFFVLPAGFMSYVPFIDKVSPPYDDWIMMGIPLAVMALAILAAAIHTRRSETKSLFAAFAIFAAVDGAISLLIYVPAYMGM